GLHRDVPAHFNDAVQHVLDIMPARIDEYEGLLTNNPIFQERTQGVGVITPQQAIAWGVTGPSLRASGINWDLRKAQPYSSYPDFQFDVPLGSHGDVYDRYLVRIEEMRQSVKIVQQALDRLPDGPVGTDNRKVSPPPRHELADSMESLIHHFKLWTEGFKAPEGEVYVAIESPRGEVGVYLQGNGTAKPGRVHFRAPSFANLQAMPVMCEDAMVADLVAIIGSIDIVLGDVDR
ncbi:MAG: NADH-quinone oxidoreductase subunit D, partial [Chloroflexi bacterium]|nr:NADH-quinone oxidoreductase subunit D [Chloroflexota bacterium]